MDMETSSLINKTFSSSSSCSGLNNNVPNNPHSQTATFLSHNGFIFPHLVDVSDIEMIAIQTVTYTSLRDLLPSSPPTIASPTHNSSWHDEIPIKNPLVKHAALAYLQPMSTPPDSGGKGLFRRIKEKCGCGDGVGCLDWLRQVVWKPVREALCGDGGRRDMGWDEDDDDEEEDEDDEDYVKVD